MADDNSVQTSEASYTRERLLADSWGFFKQPRHVVAGALAQKGVTKKSFTRSEVERLIKQFKDSESYVHPISGSAA